MPACDHSHLMWYLLCALPLAALAVMCPAANCFAGTCDAFTADKHRAIEAFDLSPAVFVENKGQWDSGIRYGFDGKGVRVSFTDAGPVFQMLKSTGAGEDAEMSQAVFSATFVGGKPVRPTALDPSSVKVNYYRGNDASKWLSGVPTFTKVAYKGLYDGVDLCTWGKRSGLKYEFHVAPSASWERIVIKYEGIEGLSIDDKGALHVRTSLGEIVDGAPVVYQETAGGRAEIAARYRLVDESSYCFEIRGAVDDSLPIIIDPDLVWASYLGSDYDIGCGIAVDASGSCYVTGHTESSDFPTPGGFDTSYNGWGDAFVAKVTSSGQFAWASYLGGSGFDSGCGIAVDASGDCYVTGYTASLDFLAAGGFDTRLSGVYDAFVARVTSSGQLAWASYLGGSGDDSGQGIALDASANCYVTGWTDSPDFPTAGGFDTSFNGGTRDAFVAKVTSSGQIAWASYLGGGSTDGGSGIAADASGNCYVTGYTASSDFPTPGGFDTSPNGYYDAFVAKVTSLGQLAWASYLGGGDCVPRVDDHGYGIAVDASGNCYVTGQTQSWDFPTPGGFDTSYNGGTGDAFVAKVTSSGQLAWASYLGGSNWDWGNGIGADASGNCYVTGFTQSSDFPTPGGFDTSLGGGDAFVVKVTSSGQLAWASYLGGSSGDGGRAIAVDASGSCYVTGDTTSSDFPTPGGFDTRLTGSRNAFVAKVGIAAVPPSITTSSLANGQAGVVYSQTLAATGGTSPYTWSLALGSLPPGLSLGTLTGAITGTPGATGTSNFTARVTDHGGSTATQALSITINAALAITTSTLPGDTIGVAYNQTLTAAGGVAPYTWVVQSGSLPAGLSLNAPAGAITGTPSATGTSSFTARATDNVSATATKAFFIVINPGPIITTVSLSTGVVGAAYSQVLASMGGTAPMAWSVSAGSLPAGLSFTASTGAISGTPTALGTANFTVTVADNVGVSATKALSIVINGPLAIATASLPDGAIGVAYSQTVEAVGGVVPYTWSILSGSLPVGLSLAASTGVISGTPTNYRSSSFTVKVRDSQALAKTATKALSIGVYPALPSAEVSWLEITKLQIGLPASVGHDSFVLQGTCNVWPSGVAPGTLTLRLDSTWSLVVGASSWKRVGKSNVYAAKQGGVTCKMTYWVNGTSKCLLQFNGSRQTLRGLLPNPSNIPVRLQIGSDFDETVMAVMMVRNHVAKLSSVGPLPLFWVQKLAMTRNRRQANHDALSFSAMVFLAEAFNSTSDRITLNIGPYEIPLPAGTLPVAKNGIMRYSRTAGKGRLTFVINVKTGALKVTATGIDLSSAASVTHVSLSIANHPGADWDYGFLTAVNKTGTIYRY